MSLVDHSPTQRSKPSTTSKTVHFSSTSELLVYDGHEEGVISYTENDYRRMKTTRKRSIEEARWKLSILLSSGIDSRTLPGDFFDVTGIENVLHLDLMKRLISGRRQCWRAVLVEQARQHHYGECDPNKLAGASLRRTEWATKRAHNIGLHQSKDRY
mmetsp:Transcript_33494/g.80963  ORF Transcript_33494/g.80963 Transcript_33494/m.80963 type:complete len:157 (+) Transcript_33494:219-689(+)|eukprot:CAMPEP_0181102616 /NCGR_PEP_ID=MMETSP1071-20121207/14415_1 /TAXON_ID=35127 /ORGANISM="Thalassiosira sp., Strain NH16" /LENGTH=156 /DNA_ID=CAMNT_0023185611 /DNA_START=146 /DNA_END=616 /DNA_ORIENTATION=-